MAAVQMVTEGGGKTWWLGRGPTGMLLLSASACREECERHADTAPGCSAFFAVLVMLAWDWQRTTRQVQLIR